MAGSLVSMDYFGTSHLIYDWHRQTVRDFR
jgi:hypothetical protein